MAENRVGQVVRGGEMNPIASEQAARSRSFAEQRQQLAFQQSQESGRANLASNTELASTAMKTQSNERIAGMQEGGANNRAAMAIQAEDKRNAKHLLNERENRDFKAEQDSKEQEWKSKFAQAERDWQDKNLDVFMDLEFNSMLRNSQNNQIGLLVALGMFEMGSKNETNQTQMMLKMQDMATQSARTRELIENKRTHIKEDLEVYPGGQLPDVYLNEQIKKLGTTVNSISQLGMSNYSVIEEAITNKTLGKAEIENLILGVQEIRKKFAADSEKNGRNPEIATLYGKVKEAEIVLHKLQYSNNPEISKLASEAWSTIEGNDVGYTIQQASEMLGGIFDPSAIYNMIKNANLSIPEPEYVGKYKDRYAAVSPRKNFDVIPSFAGTTPPLNKPQTETIQNKVSPPISPTAQPVRRGGNWIMPY